MAEGNRTFYRFASLPTELRDRIWRDALPREDQPCVFFYNKGSYSLRTVKELVVNEADEETNPDVKERCFMEPRRSQLALVSVSLPLVFVNRQARIVALDWAREHGIELRQEGQRYNLARSFGAGQRAAQAMQDCLYISKDRWEDFFMDPRDEQTYLGFDPQMPHVPLQTCVAGPETALKKPQFWDIISMLQSFDNVKVFCLVVDAPPDLRADENGVQRRWELETIKGGTFTWNAEKGKFEPEPSEYFESNPSSSKRGKSLLRRIERFGKKLAWSHIKQLEMRLVTAVKR